MVEWTIGLLCGTAMLLLAISIYRNVKASKEAESQITMTHISILEEIKNIKTNLRNLELDYEILTKETGINYTEEQRQLKREILDQYKRGFSIENIASEKEISIEEVKRVIAPSQKGA